MVQVATIRKESADVCRLVIDLTIAGTVLPTLNPGEGANYQWLNTETVTGFQTPVVTAGPGLWSSAPLPTFPLPTDPSPVTVKSATVVDSNTAFQLFIQSGTAGNVYTVSTTIQDSVGRFVTLEVAVIIAGTPAVVTTPIATVPPGALPLLGGTMLGPLYLFESPLTGTEAATKAYVDASIANGFTTSNISATGTLLVAGATTLHALAATSGTFSSTLAITGATTLTGGVAGNMLATGNVSAGGTLGVTGAATLSSTLAVTGNTTVGGTLGVTSNATVGGTLGVTGATTLASLGVTGNATVGGTLGVTGAATLSSTLAVTGNTTVGGTLGVTSNATVGGTLGVTGATTVTTLTASGLVSPASGVGIKGSLVAVQAGSIGETIQAIGSGSFADATPTNLASITLSTKGVWSVFVTSTLTDFSGVTTMTDAILCVSTASATLASGASGSRAGFSESAGGISAAYLATGPFILVTSSPTNVYAVGYVATVGSTGGAHSSTLLTAVRIA